MPASDAGVGHVLAESFASSPAGYIVGVGLPVLVLIIGGLIVRYERSQAKVNARLDQLGAAMTANSQALALLVQQSTDDRKTLARIPDLDTAVAVLRDRVDRHEVTSATEHQQLRDTVVLAWSGNGPRSTPRPTPSAGA